MKHFVLFTHPCCYTFIQPALQLIVYTLFAHTPKERATLWHYDGNDICRRWEFFSSIVFFWDGLVHIAAVDWNTLSGMWMCFMFSFILITFFPSHYVIIGQYVPWTWIPWLFSMASFVVNNFLTFLAQIAQAWSLSVGGGIQKGLSGIWAHHLGLSLFLGLFSGLK